MFRTLPCDSSVLFFYCLDVSLFCLLTRYTTLNEDGAPMTKSTPYWPLTLTFVQPFTITGHPVVTMPMGTIDVGGGVTLPVGCQVVGRRGGDVELLATCRAIEDGLWGENVGPPRPPSIEMSAPDLW